MIMKHVKSLLCLATLAAAGLGLLAGCTTTTPSKGETAGANGSKLWAQNCNRCHNSPSADEYSSAQWDIIMLHMRVRAGLTASDSQAIREFLQSAN